MPLLTESHRVTVRKALMGLRLKPQKSMKRVPRSPISLLEMHKMRTLDAAVTPFRTVSEGFFSEAELPLLVGFSETQGIQGPEMLEGGKDGGFDILLQRF